ncbi:hypothetical protein T440DRAFT_203598 [Plenodomus tracheiphilus IPT5]|uniref:Uncharacterized protein n=1 Tax=Plenodomus tracheiphilus IPT5 TaxID=1408161 RepID=A0A6A7BHU0_9PLEO|nr:hypothetical protein T440DRAFT_203598 [Plenodomus tracheiphilus IPT5]
MPWAMRSMVQHAGTPAIWRFEIRVWQYRPCRQARRRTIGAVKTDLHAPCAKTRPRFWSHPLDQTPRHTVANRSTKTRKQCVPFSFQSQTRSGTTHCLTRSASDWQTCGNSVGCCPPPGPRRRRRISGLHIACISTFGQDPTAALRNPPRLRLPCVPAHHGIGMGISMQEGYDCDWYSIVHPLSPNATDHAVGRVPRTLTGASICRRAGPVCVTSVYPSRTPAS